MAREDAGRYIKTILELDKDGDSMFTIYTADMMAFYATAANKAGTTVAAIVAPITR